jgi:hypothetical protein
MHRQIGHRVKIKVLNNNQNTMSQAELYKIRQEVKERELAKMRYQWFREYHQYGNIQAICRKYGIHRSRF